MSAGTGRFEKRINIELPVLIERLEQGGPVEKTFTQNVSPLGVRVVSRLARSVDQHMLVTSLERGIHKQARVVYCQPLSNGRFGVGLQFQGAAVEWGVAQITEAA